jgi:hypothetical protein
VQCGDACDDVVDRVAAASAWAQDLVVFEAGDDPVAYWRLKADSSLVRLAGLTVRPVPS